MLGGEEEEAVHLHVRVPEASAQLLGPARPALRGMSSNCLSSTDSLTPNSVEINAGIFIPYTAEHRHVIVK